MRTIEKKRRDKFLENLSESGNVTQSAKLAALGRSALYKHRREDEEFAREWDEASELGLAALEDEARRRAFEGWEEPVWHQGKMCGLVRKFSDTLLIFLLKGGMPNKYRDTARLDHTSSDGSMSPAPAIDLGNRTIDELHELAKKVIKAADVQ
jgi:hypothetical protein